jgi:diguanylate cyclase (GGDEF)-like protein
VAMVTGIALLTNWSSNKQIPGLLGIAAGYMATCVGFLLASLQGSLPPVISIFLANALIMGGRIPVLFGLANFWNQENTRLPLFYIIWFVGSMAGFYYFTFVDENILWRIRIYTVMMVVFSASVVYVLAKGLKIERKLRPVMAINTTFGAFLLLTLSLFNAVTEFTLMFFRGGESLNSSEEAAALFLLSSIVTMTIFALSVIIMTMEELKVEYQENAIFDPITTILNERAFIEVSNRVLGVALRYTKPVSMLTLEVTNLDDIVKQHGTKVGNAMLRHFALMATDRRRNEDVLARSNYKQFRMLLPGIDEAGSKVVIKKIEESLLGEEYIYRGNSIKVEFLICAITKREEDLQLQQMLQEGEVDIIRMKQKQQTPA